MSDPSNRCDRNPQPWPALLLCLGMLLLTLTAPAALAAEAAPAGHAHRRPAAPWPGPRGAYVFVEGEQFETLGEGWAVREAPRGEALVSSGGQVLSGAGRGNEAARTRIEIPESGPWKVLVRYSRWPGTDRGLAPFRVQLVQQGAPQQAAAFDHVFGQGLTGQPDQRVHSAQMHVGSAQSQLQAGSYELVIDKMDPEVAAHPTMRWIDCVLLTRDEDYEFDYRDFGPQVYLQIKLESCDLDAVYFYCFVDHLRQPWYVNTAMHARGWDFGIKAPVEHYLKPGQTSDWLNITRTLYSDTQNIMKFQATKNYHNPDASQSSYELAFATAPDPAVVVKRVARSGPGPGLTVRMPALSETDLLPRADYEIAQARLDRIAKMPQVDFGRRPTKYPVLVHVPGGDFLSPNTRQRELEAMKYLGVNGSPELLDDEDVAAGLVFGATGASVWHMGAAGYNDPDLKTIQSRVARSGSQIKQSPHAGRLLYAKLMDEAGALSLEQMNDFPLNQAAFARWAKQHNVMLLDPADEIELAFGDDNTLGGGDSVELARSQSGPARLWYHSQRFRAWSVVHFFQQATRVVREHYPSHVHTTQNFSDGAVYLANLYAQGNDYPMYFRQQALDAAMSEDWTNHGATHQLCSWNVALLRAATKYHQQPIHMLVISSFGRSPLLMKLKAVTDISEGANSVEFYAYAPPYSWHESGWAESDPHYPALAELSREIGAAEELLVPAEPRKAQVAMLYSIPDDIWSVQLDNSQGVERMLTYLALRQGQIPVDVLYDADVQEGQLEGYKVAYAMGSHWPAGAAQQMARWVRAGGTLVLGPGAVTRDELNQPLPLLAKELGLPAGEIEHPRNYYAASMMHCRDQKPLDQVELLDAQGSVTGRIDALATKQPLSVPEGAQVLARFGGGQPAALVQRVGQGRVVSLGFLPALAYMQQAWQQFQNEGGQALAQPPARVAQTMVSLGLAEASDPAAVQVPQAKNLGCPVAYDPAARRWIAQPTELAGVDPPIRCDTPLVEATFMESEQGWVIPLANYTGSAIEQLTLNIQPGEAHGPVFSSRQGELKTTTSADGRVVVTLPLESTDFIFAHWK